jgi:peroxiredoxin
MTVASGDVLPDLPLTDTSGRTMSLRDLRGEATLLVFLRHLA